MRIRRTRKIDRRGLTALCRKFNIAPVFLHNLQRGQVIELPDEKAEALVSRGYAINAGGRAAVENTTTDDRDIKTPEKAEELDDGDDYDESTDEEDRDIKL